MRPSTLLKLAAGMLLALLVLVLSLSVSASFAGPYEGIPPQPIPTPEWSCGVTH